MSRSWTVSNRGIPKKGHRPHTESCLRKASTRELLEFDHEEDGSEGSCPRLGHSRQHAGILG